MTHRALISSAVLVAAACSSSSNATPASPADGSTPANAANAEGEPSIPAVDEDDPRADIDPSVPPENMSSSDNKAVAVLTSPEGIEGTVTFEPSGAAVVMHADIRGLTPGKHGFHIHENGDCAAADFSSAGGHFDPEGRSHGGPTADEHHVGDLGNLEVGTDGVVSLEMKTDFDLSASGSTSILGKAVIVHEKADDLQSQPSGDAGRRVACGVIAPEA